MGEWERIVGGRAVRLVDASSSLNRSVPLLRGLSDSPVRRVG